MKIKKFISTLLLISMLFSFTGCYTLIVETPENQNVKLMYSTEQTLQSNIKTVSHKKFFYLFWGLLPIGNNSTAEMINDVKKEARVVVKTDFIDILIGMLTLGILSSQTVTVDVPQ